MSPTRWRSPGTRHSLSLSTVARVENLTNERVPGGSAAAAVACPGTQAHHGRMTQPQPELEQAAEDYEAWRDLQDVLEERDREWWAEAED